MSPRTGRPPKAGEKKAVRVEIRLTAEKAEQLQRCAKTLNVNRVDVIERGIDLVEAEIKKK